MSAESVAMGDAAAIASEVARRAQVRQMQIYVANVQGFFEGVLTDLLLQQPSDPHAFLLQALQEMPVSQRQDIANNLKAQDERKYNQEDPEYNRAKHQLHIVLTLPVNEEPAAKASVIATLQELQAYARQQPACIRFDIGHNPNTTSILVNQTWASQAGLDAYYASAEFQQATPKFRGLLADMPDERVYQPV